MSDAVAYKNGAKNQWRRTAWNAIADGVQDRADALVLYLPGSTDLDRPEALRRGFKPANLIAVERQPEVCELLRAEGATTICGSLTEVLEAWPVHVPVRCVVADFQCGITEDVIRFWRLCSDHPAMSSCAVLVNLQRGRDPLHCEMRSMFSPSECIGVNRAKLFARILRPAVDYEMHTALDPAFKKALAECYTTRDRWREAVKLNDTSSFPKLFQQMSDAQRRLEATRDVDLARVVHLPSYRSTAQTPYMDSCVITWHGDHEYRAAKWTRRRAELSGAVAAALAIRTRRLRGELGGGKRA